MLKIFKTPRFQAQCKAGPGSPPHFCIKPCLRVLNPIPIASLSLSLSTYWKLNNPIFIVRKLCVADFSKSFNLLRIRKVILEKNIGDRLLLERSLYAPIALCLPAMIVVTTSICSINLILSKIEMFY